MYTKCTLTMRVNMCELAPALSLECFQTSMLYSVSDFDSANKCFQATHHCCPSPA